MKLVNYKRLKNDINRYDIGKMPTDSGFLRSTQSYSADFTNTPTYNMSNETSTVRNSMIPNTISQVGTIGNNIKDMFKGFTSMKSAATTNVNNALSNKLIEFGSNGAPVFTEYGAKMAIKGGASITGTATTAGAATGETVSSAGVEAALKGAGLEVAKSGMSAAGYAAGAIGAALGTYGIINDAIGFGDRLKGNDMINMAGRGTESKYGVSYNTYNGLDSQGIRDYTNALNTSSTLSMSMNGLSTGASIGGMIGGPLGMGIGAGIGLLGGLVGGLVGSHNRSKKVELSMNSALSSMQGSNLQAASVAGSQGLRNQYNATHADKGKNVYDDGKSAEYKSTELFVNNTLKKSLIHTERGVEYGIPQGLAEPREGLFSMTTPYTHYLGSLDPNVVEERKDKIPVGSNYDWGKLVILGNENVFGKKDYPRYADLGRQPLKQNEKINLKREAGLSTPEDEITYMKNWNFLRRLGALLSADSNSHSLRADKGKNIRRFDKGWESYAPIAKLFTDVPLFMNHRNIIGNESNVDIPVVDNPNAKRSSNILYNLKVDPTQQLNEINRAQRLARYDILNSPLSAGMKNAMSLANIYNARNTANQVISETNRINNSYLSDAAKADMAAGDSYAKSANQINEFNKQNLIKQNSDQRTMLLQLNADKMKAKGQLFQDWDTARRYNQMMKLYNLKLENENTLVQNEVDKNKPVRPIIIGNSWLTDTPLTFSTFDDRFKKMYPLGILGPKVI